MFLILKIFMILIFHFSQQSPWWHTLTAWKAELDPFVTVMKTKSSRILPVLLELPGFQPTVHINIYLPTSGRDKEYFDELTNLQVTIEEVIELYPTSLVCIRGDANASFTVRNKNKRDEIFRNFCEENFLKSLPLKPHTYHHFMGEGISESSIDVLLSSSISCDGIPSPNDETLIKIMCCKEDSRIFNSHHDAILSSFETKYLESPIQDDILDVPFMENH